MHHVALVGYGTFLVPRAPFFVGSTPGETDDLVIAHHGQEGARKARIVPTPEGCRLQLGPGTSSIDDVVDALDEVDAPAGWRLELDGLSVPKPRDVMVWSVPDETPWAAELTLSGGTRDEMAYLLGPFAEGDAPRLEALVAPRMQLVADGWIAGPRGSIRAIELAYSMGDVPFRQWRILAPLSQASVALVTAQAALARRDRMRELAVWLASNL
jgi:hypothetical protein